jgi:hypothetical protein
LLFINNLVEANKGWWVPITAPSAFTKAVPNYFSLQEIKPVLKTDAKWTRVDTYKIMRLPVEFYLQTNWVYLGVPIDEPEFASPRAYYAASIGRGIEGLDYNVPTNVKTRGEQDLLQSRVNRTP